MKQFVKIKANTGIFYFSFVLPQKHRGTEYVTAGSWYDEYREYQTIKQW